MSHKSSLKHMLWSEQTYRLSDVVHQVGFPCVVRVCHGYYSSLEMETFSHGDLLHLKNCVTLQKAAAHFIQRERTKDKGDKWIFKTIGEEVLIPLNFKGPMKLVNDCDIKTTFNTVQELIDSFPRFVRIDKDIEGLCGKRGTRKIKLSEGKRIQLIRLLPGTLHKHKKNTDQLICLYKDKEVALSASSKGKFTLLADDSVYTLAGLVDTLPLPRYARFIDEELQQGGKDDEFSDDVCGSLVRLDRIALQKIILGYHEPDGIETSHHGPDGVIALPLDNQAVKQLEVNILQRCDRESYKKIMPKNIMDILDKEDLSNWLYVERASNPKVRYLFDDFPGRKVKKNTECCCIDDISSTRFERKAVGSTSGSQDGWSSSEFSMTSQDIVIQGSVYDSVDDISVTKTTQDDQKTNTTLQTIAVLETEEEPVYEDVMSPLTPAAIPVVATASRTTTTNGSEDQYDEVKETTSNIAVSKTVLPPAKQGYINMPFFKRGGIKQSTGNDEYEDVKTPPPKPPRKDKGLKRLFTFRSDNKKPLKSVITDTLESQQDIAMPDLETVRKVNWRENPIYFYGEDTTNTVDTNTVCDTVSDMQRTSCSDTSFTTSCSAQTLTKSNSEAYLVENVPDTGEYSRDKTEHGEHNEVPVVFSLTETDQVNKKSTNIETLPNSGLTKDCFKKLANVCEMDNPIDFSNNRENEKNPGKGHSRELVNSREDIDDLIDYCNAFNQMLTDNDTNLEATAETPIRFGAHGSVPCHEGTPQCNIQQLVRLCEEEKDNYDKWAATTH